VAVAAAYHPALHGTPVWDDAAHLTHPALRSLSGLWRIWTDLGATQQYYPLTHTAFWIQARLWGDAMLGYHVVNVALHAGSAFLLALLLRRLAVPGAVLAAVVFALHPVQVESVAWVSELKNTLSGILILAAALAYLRFDETRDRRAYAAAVAGFVLALLAKTVAATLPAALLVVLWWRRGRLRPREDVMPLVPLAALGAAAGLLTAWVERHVVGARGAEFGLSLVERVLLAGRAVWFYFGKLVWPADLTFTYPRWELDPGAWWQVLFPLGVLAAAAVCWRLRRRTRAPFAVLALFVAGLFPALGFVDVFPFRYSFVADHFQYHASIPVLAALAALITLAVRRLTPAEGARAGARAGAQAAAILLVGLTLAALTWRQSRVYASAETLYHATLARNPSSWMAHNNLALVLMEDGRAGEARAHFEEALRLNPDVPEHSMNLGRLLVQEGRLSAAIGHLETALRLDPALADAHNNLGVAFLRQDRPGEAVGRFEEALRLEPGHAEARQNLGAAHYLLAARAFQANRPDEGVARLRAALEADPRMVQAHNDLGAVLQMQGELETAIGHYEAAIALRPDYADAYFNLANALFQAGRLDDAAQRYREAARLAPGDALVRNNLGMALLALGRNAEAAAEFAAALELEPGFEEARRNLARASAGPRR
jgi:tetratricopeptide (TPR) repeat protein